MAGDDHTLSFAICFLHLSVPSGLTARISPPPLSKPVLVKIMSFKSIDGELSITVSSPGSKAEEITLFLKDL